MKCISRACNALEFFIPKSNPKTFESTMMSYPIKPFQIPVFIAIFLIVPGFVFSQEKSLEASRVEVVFQNTSTKDVALVVMEPSGDGQSTEKIVVEKLAPGMETAVESMANEQWIVKIEDEPLMEYEVNENEQQFVDIALEASWQLPVNVIFANTTDNPMDVVFVLADGTEELLHAKLSPNSQWDQPGVTPGSIFRLKRGEELVFEFMSDNTPLQVVDLKEMIRVSKESVSVEFQNTGSETVDISWQSPRGHEILYLPEMPRGTTVTMQSYPGHVWMVRKQGELIGTYVVGADQKQTIDIVELARMIEEASKQDLSTLTEEQTGTPNSTPEAATAAPSKSPVLTPSASKKPPKPPKN